MRKEQNFEKLKDIMIIALAVFVLLAAGFSGFYIYQAGQYRDVFFLNTYINGIDASGMTVAEVESLINSGIDGYRMEINGRGDMTEYLSGDEINLHSEFDGSLEAIIKEQKPYAWGLRVFHDSIHEIAAMIVYDESSFEETLRAMSFFDPELVQEPVDASLSDYIKGEGYTIIPEQEGTVLKTELAIEGIRQAMLSLRTEVSLDSLNVYMEPEIRSTDERLNAQKELRNSYVGVTITHQFGEVSKVLDGETIHQWMTFLDNGVMTLDEEAVAAYVADLARDYNTSYQPKTLDTSYGKTVRITGGSYGWRINQSAETAAICEIIRSAESQSREPIYSQTAASHGETDYGNTYVEINLTAQHLFYYKDGKLLVDADFVSGNESRGWSTPAGAYPLTYKQRDAVLRGEGYTTPVSYWMPFNGGIGLHDASWRSSFGGTIYKTNGSHGCINLPPSAAQTIYENITAGTPVLCYHLAGTSGSSTAAEIETAPAATETAPGTSLPVTPAETGAAIPETSPVPETAPLETNPAQTTAPETAASETASSEPPQIVAPETTPPETTAPETTPAPTVPATTPAPETSAAVPPETETSPAAGQEYPIIITPD